MEYWSIGVLEYWSIGAPNGRARVKILEENCGRRNLALSEKNGYADCRLKVLTLGAARLKLPIFILCRRAALRATTPLLHYSITPLLHYSITPLLHYSTTPLLHYS